MKKIYHYLNYILLATVTPLAHGQTMHLTTDVPDCRMPTGKVLPYKYYLLAKNHKEFAWVLRARTDDREVSGKGWARIDGSSMFNWFEFFRTDLDNDSICDWYLNASAPLSTGGDRDSINTIYIGHKKGWSRTGAHVPNNKPDQLGSGNAIAEQKNYLFGEEIAVIHDAMGKTNYIVSSFYDRHMHQNSMPGYRILVWDDHKKTLGLLDKWEPESKAAKVYAFFKVHGARRPVTKAAEPEDEIERFNKDIEAFEISQACDPESTQRAVSEERATISSHLLKRCK